MRAENSWPEGTFAWESENQEHYCGSHWEPFYENVDDLLDGLPGILGDARPFSAWGNTYPGPHEIPEEWAKGVHLCWPNGKHGLIATLRTGERDTEVINLYPFVSVGTEVSIDIHKVFVWSSGVAAQIEGGWCQSLVTFFDISFLNNRAWYEAGKRYNFVLSGIAYKAGIPALNELPLIPDSALALWERSMAEPEDERKPGIRLDGAAIFASISEWDRDDYWFRGTVRKINPFEDLLGQSGWRVRATVMRFDDENADLDIFITRRAWSSDKPPEVGQDIEGTLWLQGRLWSTV